jgi:lipopolysaccharide transport system ATP-binding protein
MWCRDEMRDPAVRIRGLRKQYRIGVAPGAFSYRTLRDAIADTLTSPFRGKAEDASYIWALDGVDLQIDAGEVVGLIGRNGAGKSTLLKILSRITRPTEGEADLFGRVGSLLEVGTGFHPELTGRENIYLNGAILGMRRDEIRRKFDDIVDFSGVAKFIDTSVRHYSSGMYVRLAFAVAAHLEPEILLVDEVLAVGDAAFQRQCLGKMQDVSRSGRTVIFVSHNMPAVTRLCSRALLLSAGRVVDDGAADAVVARYLASALGTSAERSWEAGSAPGNESVRVRSIRVVDDALDTVDTIDVRRQVGIEVTLEILGRTRAFVPMLSLLNDMGQPIFSALDTDPAWLKPRDPGVYRCTAWIPPNLLNEGLVMVTVTVVSFVPGGNAYRHAAITDAVAFQVTDAGEGGTARGDYTVVFPPTVRPLLEWSTVVSPRQP